MAAGVDEPGAAVHHGIQHSRLDGCTPLAPISSSQERTAVRWQPGPALAMALVCHHGDLAKPATGTARAGCIVPAALCSITVALAVTHQHPRRIKLPHGVVAAPPAPSDVVSQLVTAARIGLVTGALVLALAAFCFWRLSRTPGASARVASHVWLVRLTAIGSTCLGIYLTALEFIAGLSYEWAVITAFAGPLGIAGIAAALALLRAEKQRGRWISLWDVFPRLAPRCKESPMTVESLPTHPQTMSVS